MINPYPIIDFEGDIARIASTDVSVCKVMGALSSDYGLPGMPAEKRRMLAAKTLRITIEQIEAAERFARDSWCTPKHVADVLPPRDRLIDPCSNPRSFVDACERFMLERGDNGLVLPWVRRGAVAAERLLAYVNAGFSDLFPWADKLRAERGHIAGAAFMCNVDNSTRWWMSFTEQCGCVFLFSKRLPFIPHPGMSKSTNNKAQALIGDRAFFEECKPGLFELGEMYEKTRARRAA